MINTLYHRHDIYIVIPPSHSVHTGFILNPPAGLNDSMSGAMQLLPDPLYSIPTDNTYLLAVTSTDVGRIFMAGKDGCLYEIAYQAEAGWFSQRCRKINHSKSSLSFLIPSLLQFSFSEDGKNVIQQMSTVLSCHVTHLNLVVCCRSCGPNCCWQFTAHFIHALREGCSAGVCFDNESHTVVFMVLSDVLMCSRVCQVYDLGADGQGMSRVAAMSQSSIVSAAGNIAR